MNPIIFWMLMNNSRRRSGTYYGPSGSGGSGGGDISGGALCLLGLGIAVCLMLVGLAVFVFSVPIEVLETKSVTVEIVSVNPPKHAGVEVRNVETGEVTYVSLGKRFYDWRILLRVGRRVVATQQTCKQGDSQFFRYPDLKERLEEPETDR